MYCCDSAWFAIMCHYGGNNEKNVFISYARSDGKEIKEELGSILETHAYTTFYDTRDLEAGDWLEQLINGISNCKVFVPVLSHGYLNRLKEDGASIIMKECKAALSENVAIIPFVSNNDEIRDIPDFFGKLEFAVNADELLRLIFKKIPLQFRPRPINRHNKKRYEEVLHKQHTSQRLLNTSSKVSYLLIPIVLLLSITDNTSQ